MIEFPIMPSLLLHFVSYLKWEHTCCGIVKLNVKKSNERIMQAILKDILKDKMQLRKVKN